MPVRLAEPGHARFRELDGLRGLAALGVVVYHLTYAYDSLVTDAPSPVVRFPEGAFGVQLFFLISGYVILLTARRSHRAVDFAISRVSRLYPVYWLGLALTTSVALLWAWWPRPAVTTVLANLTMVQRWFLVDNVDPVYWTLAIEMQFYVLVLVLVLLTRGRLGTRVVVGVATTWVLVSLVVAVVAGPHSRGLDPQLVATPWKILLNVSLAEFGPLFSAGCLAFLARRGEVRAAWPVGAMAAAVLVAVLLHSPGYGLAVAVVCLVFLLVVLRERTRVLTIPPLQWLGLVSYSLYVGHTAVGYLVTWSLTGPLGRNLAMLAALVAVLLVAWGLHALGEVRGTAALKRLLRRARDAREVRPAGTLSR